MAADGSYQVQQPAQQQAQDATACAHMLPSCVLSTSCITHACIASLSPLHGLLALTSYTCRSAIEINGFSKIKIGLWQSEQVSGCMHARMHSFHLS